MTLFLRLLISFLSIALTAFTSFWLGVWHERTRARRALEQEADRIMRAVAAESGDLRH